MAIFYSAPPISLSREPTHMFCSSASKPNPSMSITLSSSFLNFPTTTALRRYAAFISDLRYAILNSHPHRPCVIPRATSAAGTSFHGLCYVVGDNIDTDQIIPAEYLTLVPSIPSEYEKLGSYALSGLPSTYTTPFVSPNETKTKYTILIAGKNFGCGSSREHAPVALRAAGVMAVVAESYARIFFRNAVATGEVYPLESEVRIYEEFRTGDEVTVEMTGGECCLINHTTGKVYKLKPIGDAGPVIEAGGIFAYARKTGMLPP